MEIEKIHSQRLGETMYKAVHKSGLTVYALPKEDHSKSYALFATKYGSIDSAFITPGEQEATHVPDGIAHFLEHKMFEMPDGSDAFAAYSKTGASANAFTSFNTTAYLFSCTEQFYESLEILLHLVATPYFTDQNIAKEQGIIGQEIRMYDDDPDWRVMFNMLDSLYHHHPVKKDIAGTVESIAGINKDILYKCYNTFYNPSNMLLFVCGKVNIEKVLDYVDRYVTAKPLPGQIVRLYPEEPATIHKKLVEQHLSVSAPLFMLGFKDTDLDKATMLKRDILTAILLDLLVGKSSALYNSLYEQGLINNTFVYDFTCEEGYAFVEMGGESPSPEQARDALMQGLLAATISKEDFERAKKVRIGRFLRLFNSVENLSNTFMRSLFKGEDLFAYLDTVEALTLEDALRRKNDLFREEHAGLSIVRPYQG